MNDVTDIPATRDSPATGRSPRRKMRITSDKGKQGEDMSSIINRLVATVSLAMMLVSGAWAQPPGPPLRVATFILSPFVMQQGGTLTGFSIDLWNEIAARLGVKTSYQMTPDVNALLASLRSGNADIAVSGLFYSTERDREFDFSYPIMQAGLPIMVRDTGRLRRPPRYGPCWHCYFRARASPDSASRWYSS